MTKPLLTLTGNSAQTRLLGGIVLFLGLNLLLLTRHWQTENELAGFGLGVLLTVLSLSALVIQEKRSIRFYAQHLELDIQHTFGQKQIKVPYSDIDRIGLTWLGSPSSLSKYWDLTVHRQSAETLYLMGGCAFKGRLHEAEMQALQQQVSNLIRANQR